MSFLSSSQRSIRLQVSLLIVGTFFLAANLCQAQNSSDNSKRETSDASTQTTQAPSPPAKPQVFLPPVIEKGGHAWGSLFNENGQPLANQEIIINGKIISSDDYGLFSFKAPESSFSISVPDQAPSGKEQNSAASSAPARNIFETTYTASKRGLLVSDKAAVEEVDQLDELDENSGKQPLISHVPSIVEPEQAFVVLGKNFSGVFGHDQVTIEGFEAESFAGSSRSVIAVFRKKISAGPKKEIAVMRDEESSLPQELDLARVELRAVPSNQGRKPLELEMIGTNLPSLLALSAADPSIHLRFGGRRLGAQTIFLSPGGQPNKFAVDYSNNADSISAHILSNGLFDPYTQKSNAELMGKNVLLTINKAEVIRLKKRIIALEGQIDSLEKERIEQAKKQQGVASDPTFLEREAKAESTRRAASVRLSRLNRSLRARRVVLAADGLSEGEWSKLEDSAADNTSHSLDSLVASKEIGFTESRLLRSSPVKKPKQDPDSYAQIALMGKSGKPLSVMARGSNSHGWKSPSFTQPSGGRLVAPPAPYKFDPSDLSPFFSETLPDPIPQLKKSGKTSSSSSARRKRGRKAPVRTVPQKKSRSKF